MSGILLFLGRNPGLLSFLLGMGMFAFIATSLKQCDMKKEFRDLWQASEAHVGRLQKDSVTSHEQSAAIGQQFDSTKAVIAEQRAQNSALVALLSLPQQRDTVLKVLRLPYTPPVVLPPAYSSKDYVVYTHVQSDSITTAVLNGQACADQSEALIKGAARKDQQLLRVFSTLDYYMDARDFWRFLRPKKALREAKAQAIRDTLR